MVVLGQSLTGIIAQAFFLRRPGRTEGLVLINTQALLLICTPFWLLKALFRRELTNLSETSAPMPPEAHERRRFAAGLMDRMFVVSCTRKGTLNVLKLVFAFNERDGYTNGAVAVGPGRALIVTSRDDAAFSDVELLTRGMPHAKVHELPSGYGHVAPQVFREGLYARIQESIDALAAAPA